MRILVLGGGALAGQATTALRRRGHTLWTGDPAVLETRDPDAFGHAIASFAPAVVIDCFPRLAPPGPRTPGQRVERSRRLASAAATTGAFSVFVSCADVFDGRSVDGNVESDEPSPATASGTVRLRAERAVAEANHRHAIVRTSWLVGRAEGDMVSTLLERARGEERVEVDAETRGCPTFVPHLAEAIADVIRRPGYGVLHLAARGTCTEFQVARLAYRVAGLDTVPVPTVAAGPGPPRHWVLTSRRSDIPALPEWRVGLTAHVRSLVLGRSADGA